MRRASPFRLLLVCALLMGAIAFTRAAHAQGIPNDFEIESLVKGSLATFNDANRSGNYAVMHALGSRQIREQLTPETFHSAFKPFRDQQIDISPVLTMRPTFTERPAIDNDGRLALKGRFDTSTSRQRFPAVRYDTVAFDIALIQSEGLWKVIRINVDVK